jgi:hypothetical protein
MGKICDIYCDLSKDGVSRNIEGWQSSTRPIFVERDNCGGRMMIINQGDRRLYFALDKALIDIHSSYSVKMEVKYFDEGVGHFLIVYNTKEGARSTPPVLVEDSGKWRTVVIYLEDAVFNSGICSNDFALDLLTNEYGCSNCNVIFGSLSIVEIARRGAEIKVTADSTAGYTFFDKEKIGFDIELKNIADTRNIYELLAVFLNSDDEIIQKNVFDIDLNANEVKTVRAVPQINKYGCYRMRLECRSKDGEEYSYKNVKFALSMNASDKQNDFLGTCVHFTYRDSTAISPLIAATGIKTIRDEFLWSDYEKEEGVFNFCPEWERYLKDVEDNNIEMLTILGFNNPLYHKGDYSVPNGEELEYFKEYVRRVVTHLGDRCNMYEIWNEPNLGLFSTDVSPQAYIRMMKPISETIRSVNPRAYIAAPGLSGEALPWVEKFLQLGGGEYIDAISFHPYLWVKGPGDGEYLEKLRNINALIEKYNPRLEMMITEMGWASNSCNFSRRRQAAYQVQCAAISSSIPRMKQHYIYEYQDSGISVSDVERNFGFVEYWEAETPYAAKSSFTAMAAYNCLTEGKRPICRYNDNDMHIFEFDLENSSLIMIWADSGRKLKSYSLKFDKGNIYDINGNKMNFPAALTYSPIYIKGEKETVNALTEFIIEQGAMINDKEK